MADSQTSNIGLFIPARGNDTGTWDTPVNANSTLLDLIIGGTATIGLNNSNIVLSAAQFECEEIIFNSTLTGSVTITFPTSFVKSYVIQNVCTGSSQFTITLETASPGQVVGCPPQEVFEVRNDGTNIKYKNFGRIGTYWDYGGSSNPAWNTVCTVPPYLPCDGTTSVSSGTYPTLFSIIGGTLPDFRGRLPAYLDASAGRISSAAGGVSGNTLFASGGNQTQTLTMGQLPASPAPVSLTPTVSGTRMVGVNTGTGQTPFASGGVNGLYNAGNYANADVITTNGANLGSGNAVPILPPLAIGGIRLIRAG